MITKSNKNALLLISCAILFLVGCKKDDLSCEPGDFLPNPDKLFFPYRIGQNIVFSDGAAIQDTISIRSIKTPRGTYSIKDCFRPSEKFEIDMVLRYGQSNGCAIKFHSSLPGVLPGFVASSDDCRWQAVAGNINIGSGKITTILDFEFNNKTFDAVYKITLPDATEGLQEMVIAKDIGFVYLKIDGQLRERI